MCNHLVITQEANIEVVDTTKIKQIYLGSKKFFALPIEALQTISALLPTMCTSCKKEIPIALAIVGAKSAPKSSSTTYH